VGEPGLGRCVIHLTPFYNCCDLDLNRMFDLARKTDSDSASSSWAPLGTRMSTRDLSDSAKNQEESRL